VQAAEDPNRDVPADLAYERVDGGIPGEAAADVRVQPRPTSLAGVSLPEERLFELSSQARSSADFACSASAPNACGSLTASSASTLRSSSMFVFFIPATNWL
jgi:hypothetical protein